MLWKNARLVPREIYTKQRFLSKKRMFTAEVQADLLTREIRDGATLTINHADELSKPLTDLAQEIEAVFEVGIQINLYASWGRINGFPKHFDEHDVFILQLEGRKDWRIWHPTIEHPLTFTGTEPAP